MVYNRQMYAKPSFVLSSSKWRSKST